MAYQGKCHGYKKTLYCNLKGWGAAMDGVGTVTITLEYASVVIATGQVCFSATRGGFALFAMR